LCVLRFLKIYPTPVEPVRGVPRSGLGNGVLPRF
jgi:hypothetical protein